MADLYLGEWDLVPELCLYEEGTPPAQATYVLERVGPILQVRITWRTSADDEERSTSFSGPVNGELEPLADAHGPDGLSLTRVDERTLDSHVWHGGTAVAWARRVASTEGALLAVVQESRGATRTRNFQVYRRR